jgi:hypothetical protein
MKCQHLSSAECERKIGPRKTIEERALAVSIHWCMVSKNAECLSAAYGRGGASVK